MKHRVQWRSDTLNYSEYIHRIGASKNGKRQQKCKTQVSPTFRNSRPKRQVEIFFFAVRGACLFSFVLAVLLSSLGEKMLSSAFLKAKVRRTGDNLTLETPLP